MDDFWEHGPRGGVYDIYVRVSCSCVFGAKVSRPDAKCCCVVVVLRCRYVPLLRCLIREPVEEVFDHGIEVLRAR